MSNSFEQAQKNVSSMHRNLGKIANDIVNNHTSEINKMIKELSQVESMTDDMIRKYMLRLSCESFNLGEKKDHSNLKAECAKALMKEAQAREYNDSEGTQVARQNIAILNSAAEQSVNILYNNVSNFLTTKLDETHRVVNTLNSILISRMSSAKLNQSAGESNDE